MTTKQTKILSASFLMVMILLGSTLITNAQNTGGQSVPGSTTVETTSGSASSSDSSRPGRSAERNNRRYRNRRSYNNRVSFWSLLFRAIFSLGQDRRRRSY